MTNTLPVVPVLHRDEMAVSYFSRLASANGAASLRQFCDHVGVAHEQLVEGHSLALSRIASLANITPDVFAGRYLRRSLDRWTVRGEALGLAGRPQRHLRVCPQCLAGDIEADGGRLGTRAWIRLSWQTDFLRACHIHAREFSRMGIGLPGEVDSDVSVIERRHFSEIRKAASASSAAEPSDFDGYLHGRLSGGQGAASYLDTLPLYVAAEFTEALGACDLYGDTVLVAYLSMGETREAGRAGYRITQSGPRAIAAFLDGMVRRGLARSSARTPNELYGSVNDLLTREPENPHYEPVRDLVRSHAERIFGRPAREIATSYASRKRRLSNDQHPTSAS